MARQNAETRHLRDENGRLRCRLTELQDNLNDVNVRVSVTCTQLYAVDYTARSSARFSYLFNYLFIYLFIYSVIATSDKNRIQWKNDTITRICAAEMAVRYAALCACRKVHT